jgi:hypothetical protein
MSVPTASSMPVSLVVIAQPVRATAAGILHSLALEVVQPPLLTLRVLTGAVRGVQEAVGIRPKGTQRGSAVMHEEGDLGQRRT